MREPRGERSIELDARVTDADQLDLLDAGLNAIGRVCDGVAARVRGTRDGRHSVTTDNDEPIKAL
ncbi:hypothetical protein [Enhygromyxa salina]|uniref:hypothetical protein n=1 Tax=Enhygromyxa salina TaxID=215803 RepID=UPI000D086C6A|nr:hypothetical protein [Enhygromyxa salina]